MHGVKLEKSSLSTEYVRVPVSAREAGSDVDPTGNVVEFAFMRNGEPASGDWVTGSWETDVDTHFARVLVGPNGSIDLDDGRWFMWMRLSSSPETVVENVGTLEIT